MTLYRAIIYEVLPSCSYLVEFKNPHLPPETQQLLCFPAVGARVVGCFTLLRPMSLGASTHETLYLDAWPTIARMRIWRKLFNNLFRFSESPFHGIHRPIVASDLFPKLC